MSCRKTRADGNGETSGGADAPFCSCLDYSGFTDFAQIGSRTTYKFTPHKGRCHSQALEIWNGFNAGGRDVHFHTGNNLLCKRYSFVVDLFAYASAGWKISEPQLFIYRWDTGEHERDEQRLPENRVAVSETTAAGSWSWTLPNFRGGIVDAVWDVTAL